MATSNSADTQREQVRKPPNDPDAAGNEEDQAIEWHDCYLGFGLLSRNSIFPQLAQSAASGSELDGGGASPTHDFEWH